MAKNRRDVFCALKWKMPADFLKPTHLEKAIAQKYVTSESFHIY